MPETIYTFSELLDSDIEIPIQGTMSIISAFDILWLKVAINDIDLRLHNEIIERLGQLGNLQEGWDSYNGAPIAENAVVNASIFLSKILDYGLVFKRPIVSPEPNGGVLLKWRDAKREFSVWFTAHKQNCIYVEVFNGLRRGNKVESLNALFEIFRKWLSECSQ